MKEEIKKALDNATQGPWNAEGIEVWRRGNGYNTSEDAHIWICDAFTTDNAHLIANAPEWLRHMVVENEKKNERIEQLEKALEFYAVRKRYEPHSNLISILSDEGTVARRALGKEE